MNTGAVLLVLLGMLLVLLVKSGQASQNEIAYTAMAVSTAMAKGVDPNLVRAIIKKESDWDPNGTNPNDPSYGLMGVEPLIGEAYGGIAAGSDFATLLHQPQKNLDSGCGYLADLFSKYSDGTPATWQMIIEMYNLGETRYNEGLRADDYYNAVEGFYESYSQTA